MGALCWAGVWLGLVEDEDDRGYDDHRGYRGYGDDYGDEDEDDVEEVPVAPRARTSVADRLASERADRLASSGRDSERVTNRAFLLSPANVQVTAEDKAKIAEGGFFNQS